ncbi:MAG: DUF5123 domain-containing protein [Tenuifilaceae bacterium]
MKNKLINTVLIIGFSALFVLTACKDDIDPIIEELTYDRAFTPIGLKAQISSVTTVTLTWTAVKDVDHYVVEIFQGTDFAQANLIHTTDVTGVSLVYALPSGDTQFSARIKSVSVSEGVTESNWTSVSFKSDPENLFTSYKVTMIGLGALTVKWTPGKAVTSLLFINNGVEKSFAVSAAEATAGSKDVTGITKGTNQIRILNGTFVRGTQNYALEGDAFLSATDDFATVVAGLNAGDVLIVEPGINIGFVGPITFSKSIKIRGLNSTSLPTFYVTTLPSLAHMFTIGPELTSADSIVFQDVILSGYVNNVAGSRTRGVFDQQGVICNVGKIKFKNSIVRNFDRHAIRIRGDVAQVIGTIEIDNCKMNDFAFGSNYGVINSSAAPGNISNIIIKNSTIYYTRGAVVSYSNGTSCQGITITNCTFNQLAQDATTTRYVIDLNATVSTGNITVTNCLFGNTSAVCAGFRTNTMVLNMTNCYYTSDFNDGTTYSAKAKMTAYANASTALWNDPVNGTFTFLDGTFVGKNSSGDPRWR